MDTKIRKAVEKTNPRIRRTLKMLDGMTDKNGRTATKFFGPLLNDLGTSAIKGKAK